MVEPTRNSDNNQGRTGQRGRTESGDVPEIIVLNDQGGGVMNVSDKASTLRAQMKHHEPIVCFQQNQREEVRLVGGGGIAGALSASAGMKNQNYLCISVKTKQIDMRTAEDKARQLDSNDDKEHQVVCFEPGIMKRDCRVLNRAYVDVCSTLRAQMGDNQPAVCYEQDQFEEG